MTDLIEFLTSKEIIMVYIVALIACTLYFIVYLIDKHYYKIKRHQNTKKLNKLVEDINYELAKERQKETAAVEIKEEDSEVFYLEPVMDLTENETDIEVERLNVVEENEELVETNKIEVAEVTNEVLYEEVKININEQPVVEQEVNSVEINNQEVKTEERVEEVFDYTTTEPDQTEAQAELKRLTEALEQAEESSKNIDLTSYEEMQEKEAIISLEELLKRSKEMYENNELTQYEDEGNVPISLVDLEKSVLTSLEKEELIENTSALEEVSQVEIVTTEKLESAEPEIIKSDTPEKFVMDDFYTVTRTEVKESKTAYKQYQSQPIISPVYGIEKTKSTTDIELENTANYEKLDEEIKKTNEFIMTLKDLQKNLE